MGNTLFSLLVKLGLDAKDYVSGLDDAQERAKGLQGGLDKVGGAILTGGLAAAGASVAALGGFLATSIGPASDLAETANKINTVFGETAGAVNEFAANAATSLGQSKQSALDAAATFGIFGKAADLSGTDLADFSTSLVGLSSDMASFYNTSPEQAIEAIGAALRGETEPIRSFGVLMDDAAMRAKALELGLVSNTKNALTPQQRVLASYALIMEQTAVAQGDFAKTSDGLANQQRTLKASFANVQAEVGTALLPLMQTLAQTLTGIFSDPSFQTGLATFVDLLGQAASAALELLPVVMDLFLKGLGWLAENEGVIVGVLAAIATAVGVHLYTSFMASLPALIAFATAAWPVIAVMAAVGAAAYLLYEAWTNNWGGMRDTLTELWTNTIQPALANLQLWLQTNIPVAVQFLTDLWNNTLLPALMTAWAWMQANLIPMLTDFYNWLQTNIPVAVQYLTDQWNNVLWPALQAVWSWIDANLIPLLKSIANVLDAALTLAVTAMAGLWEKTLQPALEKAGKYIEDNLYPMLENLGNLLSNTVGPIVETVAGFVGGKLASAFEGVSGAIQGAIGWLDDLAGKLKRINLPDWMTPGSPTPWEIGLLGVVGAMRTLSQTALPQLDAQLSMQTAPGLQAVASGPADGATGQSIQINFNGPVSNRVDIEEIAFRVAERIGRRR